MSDQRSGQDVHDGRKLCTKCLRLLPLSEFTPKSHLRSGFDSWCRPCRAANLRARRAKRRAAAA